MYVLEPHLEDLYDNTIHVLSHETQGLDTVVNVLSVLKPHKPNTNKRI